MLRLYLVPLDFRLPSPLLLKPPSALIHIYANHRFLDTLNAILTCRSRPVDAETDDHTEMKSQKNGIHARYSRRHSPSSKIIGLFTVIFWSLVLRTHDVSSENAVQTFCSMLMSQHEPSNTHQIKNVFHRRHARNANLNIKNKNVMRNIKSIIIINTCTVEGRTVVCWSSMKNLRNAPSFRAFYEPNPVLRTWSRKIVPQPSDWCLPAACYGSAQIKRGSNAGSLHGQRLYIINFYETILSPPL